MEERKAHIQINKARWNRWRKHRKIIAFPAFSLVEENGH